jgi:protein-L-isoaspartate(D-aspartate) O-methyltransferase
MTSANFVRFAAATRQIADSNTPFDRLTVSTFFPVPPILTSAVMQTTIDFARRQMIDQQIRTWEVLDLRVLDALEKVRREQFVPAALRHVAFADSNVPIGHEQVMLAPRIDGKILQALALTPSDHVLDVGTGSGFLAACFGKLAAQVRSLEIFPDLAERASANLHAAAANNVVVEVSNALLLNEEARYDAIAVTSSLPSEDSRFARALKVGGRLFMVIGLAPVMEAVKITRTGQNEWQREDLFETVIPPLVNAARPSSFVF